MTTAPAFDQIRLLDVQALDTRLSQLAHKRRTLPEHAELAALAAQQRDAGDAVIVARTLVGDIRRAVTKAEDDVEQVRQRAARNEARLQAGQGSAKDMQALNEELVSLARRTAVLEDAELEVMEQLETAEAALAQAQAVAAELDARAGELTAAIEAATSEIDAEAASVTAQRDQMVIGLDAGLVQLYDRIRANEGGLGAAALRARRCDGCRLQKDPGELEQIRKAPLEQVLRCEECSRILVRVPDSGL